MFKTIRFAALVAGASLMAAPALAQDSPVVGKWNTAVVTDFGTFNAVLTVAQEGGLEYPQYTRPAEFRGWRVPDVLLSGDHGRIDEWRKEQSRLRTGS